LHKKAVKVVELDKTTVATRVLMAVCNRQEPAESDVALLLAYYPDYGNLDLHEIACHVIEEQLQKRREAGQNKVRAACGGE
jgi:hypothetical protein